MQEWFASNLVLQQEQDPNLFLIQGQRMCFSPVSEDEEAAVFPQAGQALTLIWSRRVVGVEVEVEIGVVGVDVGAVVGASAKPYD